MIKINKKEYAWGDIAVVMFGRPAVGCTGVDYKTKKTKEAKYAMGRDAKSIQHGRRENDGTLTFTQSEIIALNQLARAKGYKDILDVEIDVNVSYMNKQGIILMDKIIQASFTELPSGMKEGDLQSEHALPFICLDIEYDALSDSLGI